MGVGKDNAKTRSKAQRQERGVVSLETKEGERSRECGRGEGKVWLARYVEAQWGWGRTFSVSWILDSFEIQRS